MNFIKKFLNSKKLQRFEPKEKYTNPNLKEGWVYPTIPKGFSTFVVEKGSISILPEFHAFDLNGKYLRSASHRQEGYENIEIVVEWPWKEGYSATEDDWDSIDVFYTFVFDGCFGKGCSETEKRRWTNQI